MNLPRCRDVDYIQFLVASPRTFSCTEAARVQPDSPFAPAHDSFTRLLHRLEPDPEALWEEAEPLVVKAKGVLVVDDSTLDKHHAKHIELVTRHWSGRHHEVVLGINLITFPITVLLSWVFLSETPPAVAYVGGAMCLVGVAVARRRPRAVVTEPGAPLAPATRGTPPGSASTLPEHDATPTPGGSR